MKWQKELLQTVIGITVLFIASICILKTVYDERLWEEIVFLKPNGDEKPGIVLVLFFVLIAQVIQIYVHMGRYAKKDLSIMIAVREDKRKWLIEKNKEMYIRGFLLSAVSMILFSLFLRRIPDLSFCLFLMHLILLLSQLVYSEVFISVIHLDMDIPAVIVLIPAALTVIDATKNLGLIVYTESVSFEGTRLIVTALLWALMDTMIYRKIKKADIF